MKTSFLFRITCENIFLSIIISKNLKPFLSVKISSYLCSFYFHFLEWQFLKCIFWGSNFKVHPRSEIHFLREQFWSAPMFWNAFFEGVMLKCTHVLKCIFWGSNYFNFLIHGCWLVWLLLYVFVKVFTTSKTFPVLTCIIINLRVIANWLQSS